MYWLSPCSTRLALGPGRAVLSLGPMAVIVLVVMESSEANCQLSVAGCRSMQPQNAPLRFRQRKAEANQKEEEGVSRYRRGWDADAKADSPDSAADRPGSPASTRTDLHRQDADWDDANW